MAYSGDHWHLSMNWNDLRRRRRKAVKRHPEHSENQRASLRLIPYLGGLPFLAIDLRGANLGADGKGAKS